MKAHRELLRNVIEEHREGRDGAMDWGDMVQELAFEEEKVYPPVSALSTSNPPAVVKGESGWIYHSTSLGCLKPYHLPRRMAINVVESAVFDPFILLTIMVNCTTMAWSSPMDPPGTQKQEILAVLEWVYLYIFTFELTMKIIAYGFFFHKNSYLRDAWCQLDFVVVSASAVAPRVLRACRMHATLRESAPASPVAAKPVAVASVPPRTPCDAHTERVCACHRRPRVVANHLPPIWQHVRHPVCASAAAAARAQARAGHAGPRRVHLTIDARAGQRGRPGRVHLPRLRHHRHEPLQRGNGARPPTARPPPKLRSPRPTFCCVARLTSGVVARARHALAVVACERDAAA